MIDLSNVGGILEIPHKPSRPVHKVSVEKTFGVKLAKDIQVTAFESPGTLTPDLNPTYKFKTEELTMFLMSLQDGDNVYLKGHSGTGKTAFVSQVAARLNYNVVQVNFDGHLLRSDLVGELRLSGGNTFFRHGLIPFGFLEPGTILLLDEVDAVAPETAFVLQRAVSEDKTFLLNETSEIIRLHPQNVIVATANTHGMGDDSSLYMAGTNVQNFSFMNRWNTVIELDYISEADEIDVLKQKFPSLEEGLIKAIASVMKSVREGYKRGELSMPLTTRDSINWAKKMSKMKKPMRTAKYTFLSKLPTQDALVIAGHISRCFKLPEGDDTTYVGANVRGL